MDRSAPPGSPDPPRPFAAARSGHTGQRLPAALLLIGLLVGAFAAGWWMRGSGRPAEVPPRQEQPTGAASSAWQLQEVAAGDVCMTPPENVRGFLKPTRNGPLPARLSDHMLDSSPVGLWEPATEGPITSSGLIRPWDQVLPRFGAYRGYAKGFNSPDSPGGFSMQVFEFPSERAALRGGAAASPCLSATTELTPFRSATGTGLLSGLRPTRPSAGGSTASG